ncbi:MAG: nicotinate-nucleotide adenylyltransferase [Pseudomonadota bacterium]
MICCYGGTFDPIHLGHLSVALRVAHTLATPVRLVLSARPSHRDQPGASIEHRLAMLELACAPWPQLVPDGSEARRDGPSYTVHTLQALRDRHPQASIGWVIGRDSLLALNTWYDWRRILELAHLIVIQRTGYDAELPEDIATAIDERMTDTAPNRPSGVVVDVAGEPPAVSATEIRRRLGVREPVAHLMPTGVFQYLRSRALYGG